MNEHDKQVSGVETTANSAPSQGRRRLVKGAMLATPAVMTLMSGRLMAAASSTCQYKLNQLTPVPGDNILWIDPLTEQKLIFENGKLGYYNTDNPPRFIEVSEPTTDSCLTSSPVTPI